MTEIGESKSVEVHLFVVDNIIHVVEKFFIRLILSMILQNYAKFSLL